jgi:ParB family chromosome partitioning protein
VSTVPDKPRQALGKGLSALLPQRPAAALSTPPPAETGPRVASIPIADVHPNPLQPRTVFDAAHLEELANSIEIHGIIQPLLVRRKGASYELIAGERRLRAAKLAGLVEVPAIVQDYADDRILEIALIENIQREDLNPLEEAQGIQRLLDEFSFTHEQAAESVGRSRSAVSNLLRLLNLAAPVQTMLLAGDLDMGHARALLAVDAATQITLANQVVNKRMSVRETEKLVTTTTMVAPAVKAKANNDGGRDTRRLEEELSDLLAATVKIKLGRRGRGQVLVDFGDLDALEGILVRLRGNATA